MACLVFSLEDGTTFTTALGDEPLTIGRHPDSMARLLSPSVSGHHASVQWRDDGFYVQDLGSRNGIRVNGAEVEEARLNDGDRVSFGDVQSLFYATDKVPEAVVVEEPAVPEAPVVAAPPVPPPAAAAPPVAALPPGAVLYVAAPPYASGRRRMEDGSGCMTAFVLTILFVGAFLLGLTLRHYQQTKGFLPNDLVEKLFSKAGKLHIESGDDK